MSKQKNTNMVLTAVAHIMGFVAVFYLFVINMGFYKYEIPITGALWLATMCQGIVSLIIYFDLRKTRKLYKALEDLRSEMDKLKMVHDEAQRQFDEIQARQK